MRKFMKNVNRLKGSLKVGVLKGTRGEVMDEDYFFWCFVRNLHIQLNPE